MDRTLKVVSVPVGIDRFGAERVEGGVHRLDDDVEIVEEGAVPVPHDVTHAAGLLSPPGSRRAHSRMLAAWNP